MFRFSGWYVLILTSSGIRLFSPITYGFLSAKNLSSNLMKRTPKAKLMPRERGIDMDLEPWHQLLRLC